MDSFWRRFRDVFFFITGVATGIAGIVGAIYFYVLKEDAERGRRARTPYTDYSRRRAFETPEDKEASDAGA